MRYCFSSLILSNFQDARGKGAHVAQRNFLTLTGVNRLYLLSPHCTWAVFNTHAQVVKEWSRNSSAVSFDRKKSHQFSVLCDWLKPITDEQREETGVSGNEPDDELHKLLYNKATNIKFPIDTRTGLPALVAGACRQSRLANPCTMRRPISLAA